MGFFTDLFKKKPTNVFTETKQENGVVNYETEPQKVLEVSGITVTTSFVINKNEKDEETAALHREATVHKEAGDWDRAISALQKARDQMLNSFVGYPAERWTRLPIFLQQAGRFDEAMMEFNRLLAETDARMAKEFSHRPKFVQQGFTHHVRATIYNKMKVACKRQKLPEEAAKYEALRDEYEKNHEKFIKKLNEWDRKDMARKQAELEKKYPSLAKSNIDTSAK